MTDHVTALARIPDSAMAALSDTSGQAGLWHLAGHLGLIAASSALIIAQVPFWGLLLPIQGVLLVFLFTLQHETTHQTPFANKRLNEWVGRLCGVVLAVPFTWFRYFHLAHHRHTNDPDHDPELASGPKPQDRRSYLIHVSGLLIGQPALRLYLLAEHDRCAFVSNMLQNTRTTYTNRAVRFLAWNMPYHAEHHAAPQVPFHKLPALNAHLQDALAETSNGYATYTRTHIKSLRP